MRLEQRNRTRPKNMTTINTTTIAALPIGEFDTDLVKNEFDAIIRSINRLNANLIVADPVSDEAAARHSVQRLSERHPDLLLIITLRGLSAPIIEAAAQLSRAPCIIWPVQGSFALSSSALAAGALRDSGVPVELLFAPPELPASFERICLVARAAKANSRIRESRIGVIGKLFPNLVSCRYDAQTLNNRLGITLLPISFDEVREKIQSISGQPHAIDKMQQEISSSFVVAPAEVKALDAGIKLHLALKQIAQEQKIDGFATECWSGFPRELGLNPCLGFVEDAYTIACEGDVMLCVSLLLVRHLTGRSAYVGDLFDLDLNGLLTLVHCGAPASLASNKREVALSKSQLAMERGFETVTCRPPLDPGPVTLFRFYGQECDKLHLAVGELLSSELTPNLTVKVRLAGDRWDFLDQCFGNHYVAAAGDIRNEMKLLGKWLGISIFET